MNNEKKFVMEVHILSDKFTELYDKNFYIEFLHKIRNEIKFENITLKFNGLLHLYELFQKNAIIFSKISFR